MNKLKKLYAIASLLFLSLQAAAQYSNIDFVENKGQWDNKIQYKGSIINGEFMLTQNGYIVYQVNGNDMQKLSESYHGHSHNDKNTNPLAKAAPPGNNETIIVRSHTYAVNFIGANKNAFKSPEKPITQYNNYFLGDDPSKWAGECKIYQAVTYKNIYPGIDVRYYTGDGKLKYDFIVAPGADPNQIAMEYDGAERLSVKNNNLHIQTSLGTVTELEPYTYQAALGGRQQIDVSYKVTGNTVKFNIKNYDKTKTLVIDPSTVFVTFTGSTEDNWGYTATYDDAGNFYSGGVVFGNGFRVTPGAFQQSFQGGGGGTGSAIDIGIMKFNSNGTAAIYATYLGGNGNEQPHSLVVDDNNQLIIAGRTQSTNFPTTQPLLGPGGGWDICITKLNAAGTGLIGSRRIGGISSDGVNLAPKSDQVNGNYTSTIRRNYGDDARSEVITDNTNIYVVSCTQSADFPVTANAFQPVKGTAQDGVVMKFNADLSVPAFISFLGGNGEDAAFVLALHPTNNNIYVAGATTSTNFPGITTGVISGTFGGQTDGFVSIISNNGANIQRSSYFGAGGADMVYGIQIDRLGIPYIMGTTTITWPVINATFSQTNGKQFISKLQPDLSAFIYSTNYGTNRSTPNISPIAFLVDRCENVYVTGWGGNIGYAYSATGTSGLTTTADAQDPTTDNNDFYFFVLEKNAMSILYASFFGQTGGVVDHVDGGTSRFDSRGVIYQAVCANCNDGGPRPTFPTTPGVVYPSNGSSNCNLGAVKIAFDLAGVAADLNSEIGGVRDTSGCVPLTVTFRDVNAQGTSYQWLFGDGSPEETTTTPSVNHTYNNIGTYNVRLISTNPQTCNITDTAYINITVRNDDADVDFNYQKLPPCAAFNYQFTNTSVPPPGKPFTANSFRWEFGDGSTQIAGNQTITHSYASPGTYIVRLVLLDTLYCNTGEIHTDTISVADNVDARFATPPFGCLPYNAVFNNTSIGGQTFQWTFGDGGSSTDRSPTHLYTTAGTYNIRLIAIDNNTCNIRDTTNFTITVSDAPTAAFSYSPNPPQNNTITTFTNNSIGGTSYKWLFGDGDSVLTTVRDTIITHSYNETKRFNACLIVYNQYECTDTVCIPIDAVVTPLVAVPNALTANNDGINDRIFVKGYNISKMTWRIFNRWGTEIFTTTNQSEGWDGKYKGVLQPQDVYHYVLDVEFFDAPRRQLKGNITLLR